MFESSQNLKDVLFLESRNEMNRVCNFRSKLIVHKQGQKLFTGSARKYNTEDLDITLQIGQYAIISDEIHNQCRRLYHNSQKHFPLEDLTIFELL